MDSDEDSMVYSMEVSDQDDEYGSNDHEMTEECLHNVNDGVAVVDAVITGNVARLKQIVDGKCKQEIGRLTNIDLIWDVDSMQYYTIPLYLYEIEMSCLKALKINRADDEDVIPESRIGRSRNLMTLACFHGFYDIVQYFIEVCKVDVNKPDKEGFPPLWHAVSENHENIVKILLKYGAKIYAETANTTALHLACYCGNLKLVNIIIEYITDIPLVDKFNKTPILAAAKHRHEKIIERIMGIPQLLMPNDKIYCYQLMGAISLRYGNVCDTIKFWKLAVIEKKKTNNTTIENFSNSSIFFHNYVTEIDDIKTIEELQKDYDKIHRQKILCFHKILGPLHSFTTSSIMSLAEDYIRTRDIDTYIDLWNYISDMQKNICAKLYRYEIVYRIKKYIEVALGNFANMNYHELMKIFIKAVSDVKRLKQIIEAYKDDEDDDEFDVQIMSEEFETILCYNLHIAILIIKKNVEIDDNMHRQFLDTIREFVRINARGVQGRSIMHLSHCQNYVGKSVFYILEYDKYCKDIGTTSKELTKILLQVGGDPNDLDENLNTPLHYVAASFPDNTDFAKLLLKNGAHLDFKNVTGWTFELLLNNKLLFHSLSSSHRMPLMCLAARAINQVNVKEYLEMVPDHLKDFVYRHG